MEVSDTDLIGNSDVKDGKTFEIPAMVEKKPQLLQRESTKSTGASAQAGLPCEGDELEKLYESRKTTVSPPDVVQPEESPPPPPDVSCRPPDPLYVRRAGLRFWCTKRILDWQRQALRAREDPEAVLKPVQEYGEESASKNAEIQAGVNGFDLADLHAGCLPAEQNATKRAALTNHTVDKRKGDSTSQLDQPHFSTHINKEFQTTHGDRKRPIGPREHNEDRKDHEDDREHAHYENDKEHGHYENDGEHGHYENDREHEHFKDDEEHKYYQYDKNHALNENKEHGHYENDGEHEHYEEHKYYQYDRNHAHYENDKEHALYENDEELSNLSTHVYADLDPDFLAAQDEIKNATAQPFYEMDITPPDEEQEQPFYKMDVTAANDKQQEQPFYEMNVASNDDNNEGVFYKMDGDQLGQPTPSENAYEDLDADFIAAQDVVDRRHGGKEPSRADSDGPRCSQNCRAFCRSRPGRMVALCVGVIIAGIAATIVAVILNRVLSFHPNENSVLNHTSLPTTSITSAHLPVTSTTAAHLPATSTASAYLPVTSQATSETTVETDRWREWTLYIRAYFQQNNDTAAGLEESYPDNEIVMALLEDRLFWPIVCRYWKIHNKLPHTLDKAIGYAIEHGITSKFMESHGLSAYSEVFSSILNALEAEANKMEGLPKNGNKLLSLSRHVLLDTDVEALVQLFPYLRGIAELYLVNCRISADAATVLAGQLHVLDTLTDLVLRYNEIGDEGVEAIAETFPHLKQLQQLNIAKNSITNVGGRAVANRLVHLQQLKKLYLDENELALSLSALAKAFANMTQLEYVSMWPITCRAASFRMAAQQVRDAVHTLAGQMRMRNSASQLVYDGSSNKQGSTRGLDTTWQQVETKLTSGVVISNRQLKINIKLLVLG
ncbi:PREDICTED: uncharacterized protein LOC109472566 [Branchiostoma belcheri]|uniref:Uncharacterized protein LOC109472566 n=1 Tax=Branchiostoma belcheri TaxID=7741 RepID=A0A6P4YFA5_BRABE|nr:PREDICTED: uncharacterized protein LOC109472566 [Branchiostoma belcheri]